MAPKKAVPPADKRQTTLFKHISGVPPPKKEQPTLDGLWAKKPAKAPAAAAAAGEASTSKAKVDEPDAMAIDEAPVAAAASSSKPAASQPDGDSPKPSSSSTSAAAASPATKKARTAPASSSTSSPTKPSPVKPSPPTAEVAASSSEEEDAPVVAAGTKRKRSKPTAAAAAAAAAVVSSDDEAVASTSKTKLTGKAKAGSSSPRKKSASPAKARKKTVAVLEGNESSGAGSGESELDVSDDGLLSPVRAKAKTKAATASIASMALLKDDTTEASREYPVWGPSDPVPYAALAHCFEKIEGTTKRLLITEYLTQFLVLVVERAAPAQPEGAAEAVLAKGKNAGASTGKGEIGADSLLKAIYLCINRICPDYEGLELGIGDAVLTKAIGEACGRSAKDIKADMMRLGDLGLVAQQSRAKQKTLVLGKPRPLTVPQVFGKLTEIAKVAGTLSQQRKINIINSLLAAAQGEEAKFLIRALSGKMRIGLAERTVIVALAHAVVLVRNKGKNMSAEALQQKLNEGLEVVKAVYSELPNLNLIIPALLEFGTEGLRDKCKLTPGVPLKPMLAKPTKAITEVLDRFEGKRFTCEYKYDGERAQIHREADGTITVYSRNSENMSAKYPDFVVQLPKATKESAVTFVLDCEAVAWDVTTRKLLPFQEITKRKRKDVKLEDITVKVHIFAFDILYLNGESLLQKELHERRKILYANFTPVDGEFDFAKSSDGDSTDEIQQFLEDSVKDSCEGLMVKMLDTADSTYEPSRRSMNWLKLKKDYLAGVGDSLDLVVVGAYYGKGKRTNVYGAFLLACFDPETEQYQTVCKIGTGFSEEVLESHYTTLKELETAKVRRDIQVGGAKPDVWFEPKIVWEVLTADLSLSPIYTAAHGQVEERGISLRFPRFIRNRDDKDADQATTSDQIAEFYVDQAVVGKSKGGDDDFW